MYRLYSGRRSHMIHCCHHLSGLWRASRHCCPHMLEMLDHRMYAYCIYKYLSNIYTLKPHKPTIVVRTHDTFLHVYFSPKGVTSNSLILHVIKITFCPQKWKLFCNPLGIYWLTIKCIQNAMYFMLLYIIHVHSMQYLIECTFLWKFLEFEVSNQFQN